MSEKSERKLKDTIERLFGITDDILAFCANMPAEVTPYEMQIGLSRALLTILDVNGMSRTEIAHHLTTMAHCQPFVERVERQFT